MKKGDEILVVGEIDKVLLKTHVTRVKGDQLWWRERYQSPRPDGHGYSAERSVSRKLSVADRGLTWAPAWREVEADAFRTTIALGSR